MKIVSILLGTCLSLSGCATRKNSVQREASLETLRQYNRVARDTSALSEQRVRLTHFVEARLERVEILPNGNFHYHPDSGYRGEATTVTIYRLATTDRRDLDSLRHGAVRVTAQEVEDMRHTDAVHRERHDQLDRKPAVIASRWWLVLLVCTALLWIVRILIRHARRR